MEQLERRLDQSKQSVASQSQTKNDPSRDLKKKPA
jgi:hypothetical protein